MYILKQKYEAFDLVLSFLSARTGLWIFSFADVVGFDTLNGEHFINFILWPKTKK